MWRMTDPCWQFLRTHLIVSWSGMHVLTVNWRPTQKTDNQCLYLCSTTLSPTNGPLPRRAMYTWPGNKLPSYVTKAPFQFNVKYRDRLDTCKLWISKILKGSAYTCMDKREYSKALLITMRGYWWGSWHEGLCAGQTGDDHIDSNCHTVQGCMPRPSYILAGTADSMDTPPAHTKLQRPV